MGRAGERKQGCRNDEEGDDTGKGQLAEACARTSDIGAGSVAAGVCQAAQGWQGGGLSRLS